MYRTFLCLLPFLQLFNLCFGFEFRELLTGSFLDSVFLPLDSLLHQIILFSTTSGAIFVLLIPRCWPFSQFISKSSIAVMKSPTRCLIHSLTAAYSSPEHAGSFPLSPTRRVVSCRAQLSNCLLDILLRLPIRHFKCRIITIAANLLLRLLFALLSVSLYMHQFFYRNSREVGT